MISSNKHDTQNEAVTCDWIKLISKWLVYVPAVTIVLMRGLVLLLLMEWMLPILADAAV